MALKRQQIMDALKARMQTILTANGYYTNLGSKVFDYKSTTFNDNDLDAINLRDETNNLIDELASGQNEWDLNLDVEIDILFKKGGTSITEARKGISDVKKAIGGGGNDITFGGLAYKTNFASDTLIHEQDEAVIVGARIRVRIRYRTNIWEES